MSSKVYVVTSVNLASAAERKKTLSFNPFDDFMAEASIPSGRHTMTIMKKNMDCEEGDFGYLKESYDIHHGLLAAGQETLGKLTADALAEFATLMNEVDSISTDLYGWVQHTSTVFGINAMWGRMNPMADPKIEKNFLVRSNVDLGIPGADCFQDFREQIPSPSSRYSAQAQEPTRRARKYAKSFANTTLRASPTTPLHSTQCTSAAVYD